MSYHRYINDHLGQEATDKDSGFKGIVVGYAQHLTMHDQYLLVPKEHTNLGRDMELGQWFDVEKLKFPPTSEEVEADTGNYFT